MKEINRRWFAMKYDKAADSAEISIFDEIGIWGIGVADFKKEFDAVKGAASIKALINSPGGDVFAGMAIYNLLSQVKDKLDVHVLGLAASISSVIALAGKSLTMDTGTYYMIHNPWSIAFGTSKDFRKLADQLDQISGSMADIYTARSALTREEVLALMDEETWMTAQEAVDNGFADEAIEAAPIAALAYDLAKYGYQRAPAALIEKVNAKGNPPATLRDFEAFLREQGGFTRRAASGISKNGFSAVASGDADEQDSGESTGEDAAPLNVVPPEKFRAMQARWRRLLLAG